MKSKYIYYLVAISFLLGSCTKNFLDETPNTNISDADFWKSSNDLKLYANGYYNTMLPAYGDYYQVGFYGHDADLGSDNMIKNVYSNILNGETILPTTGGGWAWGNLRTLNYFLDNYSRVNDSWDNLKTYIGETYFFRATFYFNMLKSFGDLPWINKTLSVTDTAMLYAPRLARNIIADSILQDLDRAIEYLPSRANAEESRLNKQIAQLFASRVALFEGTWEKYHAGTDFGVPGQNGAEFLQKAADLAGDLIDNPAGYAIANMGVPDGYLSLFNQADYSSSTEIMFWRKFDNAQGLSHRWYLFVPLGLDRGITRNMVEDYLCADGLPVALSPLYKGDVTLADVVENRDPRLAQTIFTPGRAITTNRAGNAPDIIFTKPDFPNSANTPTGYQLLKGHMTVAAQQVENSTQPIFYFRFAESLLNYAEARAELGTLTQADVDKTINVLRNRVNMPALQLDDITVDPNWIFPALSGVINEVRRERRVELACEGFRHDDIYRWAAADELILNWKPKGAKLAQWNGEYSQEVINKYAVDDEGYIEYFKNIPAMATGYKFKLERDYLLPIPSDQFVLNPGLGENNPGW